MEVAKDISDSKAFSPPTIEVIVRDPPTSPMITPPPSLSTSIRKDCIGVPLICVETSHDLFAQ